MNNIVIRENQIQNLIYEIRGKQVMLDSDLAKLYECKNGTKEINQAVKNNIKKLQNAFKQFEEKRVVNEIYYKGQIFDAYAKIKSIFKEVKEGLINKIKLLIK